jgi:lipoprotein-anchoring transpeptidase ErfK/SrfK
MTSPSKIFSRPLLVVATLALGSGLALAQYDARGQGDPAPDDSAAADDPYAYPDFDRPQRAYPRRDVPPDEQDYGGGYEAAPQDLRGPPQRRPRVASLPPDADPAYSTALDYDAEVDRNIATRARVEDLTSQPSGVITIDTQARKLYLSLGHGEAYEYGVGVGREGFAWKGAAQVGRKAYWPGWTPPKEMLLRRPDLPKHMEGGIDNPLGARALYLFNGKKDTMFRIHGTNEPDTIGQAVSSGCIRMLNADVIDLYNRVGKGTRVVVR